VLNNKNHKYEMISPQNGLIIKHKVMPTKINSFLLYLKYRSIMIIPNTKEIKVNIIVKIISMGIGIISSGID
jgi:hypothetical protein